MCTPRRRREQNTQRARIDARHTRRPGARRAAGSLASNIHARAVATQRRDPQAPAATAVAELIFLLVFESCRVLHYTSGDEVSQDDLVMTGSHIRAQEAALTDFPAAQPSGGGTFLDVTWAYIKFFDDYPEARGGNEFLSLIFNLHAMTKELTSLGLPAGAADEAEAKEE